MADPRSQLENRIAKIGAEPPPFADGQPRRAQPSARRAEMKTGPATRPFAAFEWMIATRYLRPKRADGYISIISILSLIGIALGVAALIIVMAVMNGFRHELLSRILGLNGHAVVQNYAGDLPDFDKMAAPVRKVPSLM